MNGHHSIHSGRSLHLLRGARSVLEAARAGEWRAPVRSTTGRATTSRWSRTVGGDSAIPLADASGDKFRDSVLVALDKHLDERQS
jgi:hypothetical protein